MVDLSELPACQLWEVTCNFFCVCVAFKNQARAVAELRHSCRSNRLSVITLTCVCVDVMSELLLLLLLHTQQWSTNVSSRLRGPRESVCVFVRTWGAAQTLPPPPLLQWLLLSLSWCSCSRHGWGGQWMDHWEHRGIPRKSGVAHPCHGFCGKQMHRLNNPEYLFFYL